VESLLGITSYENYEVIIIDNGSIEPETLKWFDEIQAKYKNIYIKRDDRSFNYSALNNAAVNQTSGEYVLLLNNDIEIIAPDWLSEMVSLAVRPGNGCVGAKLYYPDGQIQHAGVVVGIGGVAGHVHCHFDGRHPGYFGRLTMRQNFTAVTAACLLVKRSIYDQVGGLNEADLAVAFNDIDFCLKVHEAGYKNVWTPFAEMIHHESASRGYDDTPEKRARFAGEVAYMKDRWNTARYFDPEYNPNLTRAHGNFSFSEPRWAVPILE
jgi:GT2 family glycosyltransferase